MTDRRMPVSNQSHHRLLKDGGLFIGIALIIWLWLIIYAVFAYHAKYTSSSLVLIKESALTDRYVIPDQNYAVQATSSSASNPVLNTMGLLKSQEISAALYRYFNNNHPETLQKLKIKNRTDWERFYADGKSFLKYKNDFGTDLISIQFTWRNPQQAKDALDVILKAFQQSSLALNSQEQRSRSAYLNNQVEEIETTLEHVRREKRMYKDQNAAANLDPQSDNLVKSQIEMANRLNDAQALASGKEAEFRRYERMLGMNPQSALTGTALGMDTSLSRLQDQYYQQSQNYAFLKATLTDKNPRVVEAKAQLQQTQHDIIAESQHALGKTGGNYLDKNTLVSDPTRGSLIARMVAAQADAVRMNSQAQVMSRRLSQLDVQLGTIPTVEENLNRISEEERSLSNALFTLRQKLLESRIKEAETLSNVFIVDSPRYPNSAKFPNQMQIIWGGLLLSLLAAGSVIVVKRVIPDSITAHEILTGQRRGRRAYDNPVGHSIHSATSSPPESPPDSEPPVPPVPPSTPPTPSRRRVASEMMVDGHHDSASTNGAPFIQHLQPEPPAIAAYVSTIQTPVQNPDEVKISAELFMDFNAIQPQINLELDPPEIPLDRQGVSSTATLMPQPVSPVPDAEYERVRDINRRLKDALNQQTPAKVIGYTVRHDGGNTDTLPPAAGSL